jgi:3-oxoacyl-[acyl-carrier protein] reductase
MKIVITGASRGIGLAEARKLDNGENELFLVASSIQSFDGLPFKNAHCYGADLSSEQEITRVVQDIARDAQTVEVLVNNVGVMMAKKFEVMSFQDINRLVDVNLKSHLYMTQLLLPHLLKSSQPHIIFMSSMAAKSSIVGESVYSATKGAVSSFAAVLRNELAGRVKVSTIHAWGVNTFNAQQPDLFLKPEQIAEIVEFMITRDSLFLIESVDVSNVNQWRGGIAPWSPV